MKINKILVIIAIVTIIHVFNAYAAIDIENPTEKQQQDAFSVVEFEDELILENKDFLENNSGAGLPLGSPASAKQKTAHEENLGKQLKEGTQKMEKAGESEGEGAQSQLSRIIIVEDEDLAEIESALTEQSADKFANEEPQDAESTANSAVASFTAPEALIRVLDKFNGKTYELLINESSAVEFEDELKIRLDKCWMEPDGNVIQKHTALIEVLDKTSKRPEQFLRHWIFSHNVELNTFSTEKYHIFLNRCVN